MKIRLCYRKDIEQGGFGGPSIKPTPPPPPPTKMDAAKSVDVPRKKAGYQSTILGGSAPAQGESIKSLLGS